MKRKLTAIIVAASIALSMFSFSAAAVENTDTKPYDFNRVLYEENFNGDTALDSQIASKNVTVGIDSGDTTVISTKEQGDYASISKDTDTNTDAYFYPKYGEGKGGPIELSQCTLSELERMQISFDICPVDVGDKRFNIRFYDKYSDKDVNLTEDLVRINADGTITFPNETDISVNYTLKKWISFDFFFDFNTDTYSVYIDGNKIIGNDELKTLTDCVETVGIYFQKTTATYETYLDNIRIAIPKTFGIESSAPANGNNSAELTESITVNLSNMPVSFPTTSVTLTSVPAGAEYDVSCEDNTATITIEGGMQYETEYKVAVSDDLVDIYGQAMLGNNSITFKTRGEDELPDDDEPTPPVVTAKPRDYNRVIFGEDFNGDTSINSQIGIKSALTTAVASGDTTTTGTKEQGDYASISKNSTDENGYFRVKYGSSDTPVQSECTVSELERMQVSFDFCPVIIPDKSIYIAFYDKYSVSDTITEELVIFKTDGTIQFANSKVTKSYTLKNWMSFDVFLDFNTDTYCVYINGEEAVKDAALKELNTCVESVGMVVNATNAEWLVYMDNIRLAIPEKFDIAGSVPADKSTAVNPADDITINLSNPPADFVPTMVSVSGGNNPVYSISESEGVITIKFENGMEFETPYTVTLNKDMTDVYGQKLGTEDKSISFTTCSKQLVSSAPQFSDKVRAMVINPDNTPADAALTVVVQNADGSIVMHHDEKQLSAQSTAQLEVDFDYSSLTEGQSVYAFVSDGKATCNLLRDVIATPQKVYESASASASAALKKADLIGDTLYIEGKFSAKSEKNIILKIISSTNAPAYILPLQTDKDGEFSYSIAATNIPYGIHFVSVSGYGISQSSRIKIVRLTAGEKEIIKTAVNGADSANQMKSVLDLYKDKMNLASQLYSDNTYNTLYEQRPFDFYDKITEMIYQADTLLKQFNDADWSEYSQMFSSYSNIMLKGALQLSNYNSCISTKKNEINKLIKEQSPFSSFAALRSVFNAAVIKKTTSGDDGDSLGGSGGGGSASKVIKEFEMETVAESTDTKMFKDMSAAVWAEESVNELYNRGIVSAADNYRPLDNVTRAEFTKMLVQLAQLELTDKKPQFADIGGNEWYTSYIAAAQDAGIVKGTQDGTFGADTLISRQDMVVMALRTVESMDKDLKFSNEETSFTDSGEIDEYAVNAVLSMQRAGVVSGMGNGCFEPKGLANRAQAAVIICNLIKAIK